MRTSNVVFSAVQFLFVVALLALGGFIYALPLAPHVCLKIGELFTDRPEMLQPIGILLLTVGLTLSIGFYAMYKKRFFQLRMNAIVDVPLVRDLVLRFWQETMPDQALSADVVIHKDQKLEVFLEMPYLGEEQAKALLEEVELKLGALLRKQIGYSGEFFVTVVCKDAMKSR